jgi:hypothetical protein
MPTTPFTQTGWLEKKASKGGGYDEAGAGAGSSRWSSHKSAMSSRSEGDEEESGGIVSGLRATLSRKMSNNFRRWKPRYFVVQAGTSLLEYYPNRDAYVNQEECLGVLDCHLARYWLKEVTSDGYHRFSLQTGERELKLRAPDAKTFNMWAATFRDCGATMLVAASPGEWEQEEEVEEVDESQPSFDHHKKKIHQQLRAMNLTKSTRKPSPASAKVLEQAASTKSVPDETEAL